MTKTNGNGHNGYKSRVLELETLVTMLNQAMMFVPIDEMEKGYAWHPSPETLALLRRVRGFARSYAEQHFGGSNVA